MKNKGILGIVFAAVIIVVLAGGVSAQSFIQEYDNPLDGPTQPESVLSIATHVSEAISYQGVLEENGIPVAGNRDLSFSLYADDICTIFLSGIVDLSNVPVENGLFSVQLDFDPSVFTGQSLYLEVEVEGVAIACQEITAVPYALSLRPGATIATESTESGVAAVIGEVSSTAPGSWSTGLRGINNGTGGTGIGVHGSQAGWGWGVYGQVDGNGRGVYGKSDGENGVGVYAAGSSSTGTALMLSDGGIRVNGAGLDTNTPVFIHQATAENIMCLFDWCTEIDHPLTNGDPNAILIVTQNYTPGGNVGVYTSHPVGVQYDNGHAKWQIFHLDFVVMPEEVTFNVLVVKP